MDILIIAHFTGDLDGTYNSRFTYICDMLAKDSNNKIEIVTSDFSHTKKRKKKPNYKLFSYKITLLHESGYHKNVCLKRFISHREFGKHVNNYLHKRKKPNVIYCAVPSLSCSYYAAKYAKKNNIRFIIDIQDLWPEAFKMVFNIPIISDLIFLPIKRMANKIYSAADSIVSVSKTYADVAIKVNKKCKNVFPIFLGTELYDFDKYKKAPLIKKGEDEIWLAYVGTLGNSYDLDSVLEAIDEIKKRKKVKKLFFIIMGDGELRRHFENKAKRLNLQVIFTGRLPYFEMSEILKICDIAVNPIKKGSAGSIINKVGDYAAASLPVVNTQECEEYCELLKAYHAGISCTNGDIKVMADAIEVLCLNKDLRVQMGKGNRKLAEEKFNRSFSYKKIKDLITDEK